jgi:hypothetical protein
MRRALALVLVVLTPPLLACSGLLDPAALEEALRPEPPPSPAWVGTWEGPGMTVRIDESGLVDLRRGASGTGGDLASSVAGPAKAWTPSLEVGVGVFTTGWRVDETPHEVNGEWRMVIEGVVVVRTSTESGLGEEPTAIGEPPAAEGSDPPQDEILTEAPPVEAPPVGAPAAEAKPTTPAAPEAAPTP